MKSFNSSIGTLTEKREIRPGDFGLERDAADWSDYKGVWNYQLTACCNVDEIIGTNVETADNDDYINVYVDVAPDYGSIESDLYVVLCKSDGTDVDYERKLTDNEKNILLEMIQAYEIIRLDKLLKKRNMKKEVC